MHKISHIKIKNFRSCNDVQISLTDYTPLIGYNNAGKSNIIRAVEWAIEAKSLSNDDFYDNSKPVEVECNVVGISEEVLSNLGAHRARIEPHVIDGEIRIRTIQSKPDVSSRDVKREIWKPNNLEWDNPQGIPNAIIALFPDVIRIEAMVDVNTELSSNKTTTTIGKLIKAIMDPIISEQGERIKQLLDDLGSLFGAEGTSRAESLKSFDTMATDAIREFFPGVRARLDAPPPEIKEIFKSGKLKFAEDNNGQEVWRDVQLFGHGVLRAAQMAMVKMLANVGAAGKSGRVLLLIDEPELYMHPQMVASIRQALRKLAASGYQIIISTHSPLMIGRSDIPDTTVITKDGKQTSIRKTIRSCCDEVTACGKQIESLMLDLNNSSQFLFCDNVLFVEGDTEKALLPDIIEYCTDYNLLKTGTAIIPLNGCSGLPKTRTVLEAIGIGHRAIADLDFAFRHGSALNIFHRSDKLYKDCLEEIHQISAQYGYQLDNGLFKKGNSLTAEAGYNSFAVSDNGQQLTSQIHDLFKYHRIWIWPLGSVEYHFGMKTKGGDAIRSFREMLSTNDPQRVISDYQGVMMAIKWALGRDN